MQLYEYVIWKDEKRDKDDEVVEAASVLLDRQMILASSEGNVATIAGRQIPEEHMKDLDRIQVVIRPF